MGSIKRFVKNEYIYSIFIKFISIFIGVFQSVLIARFLGPELKGNMSYISSITAIGQIVITFGMHQAYPYFRKHYGKDKVYNDFLTITYIVYLFWFAISIIGFFFVRSINSDIALAMILIPIMGYERVIMYISLMEHPNRRNTLNLITSICEVLYLGILYFCFTATYEWMFSVLLFVHLINAIIFTVNLKCKPNIHRGLIPFSIEMLKMGFFPMLALLMTTLNYRIDTLMLKQYETVSLAQIGIYSLGISMSEKIVLIPDTLKGVLASKLAKGSNENEVIKICRLCFFTSLFLCVFILFTGRWIIKFLYGESYNGAYSIVVISAFGSLSIGYFKLIAQYNIVNKKQVRNVILLSVAIVVDIIGNLILIPSYGIRGAAIATCLGNVICGLVFIIWFSKTAHTQPLKMIIPQKEDIRLLTNIPKLIKRK